MGMPMINLLQRRSVRFTAIVVWLVSLVAMWLGIPWLTLVTAVLFYVFLIAMFEYECQRLQRQWEVRENMRRISEVRKEKEGSQ
jgi:FtsH-binding integral membrane protein